MKDEEVIIQYKYISIIPYEDLEDGTPNFHHVPRMKISGTSTLITFIDTLKKNSEIGTIQLLEAEIIKQFKAHEEKKEYFNKLARKLWYWISFC